MAFADLLGGAVVVAPMAGGPSTPELVIAAAEAWAFGFLAGGYKTADAMLAEIARVKAAGVDAFGINLFVPGSPFGDTAALAAYVRSLGPDAGQPSWDDDAYAGKVAALLASPPPVVSFTFGCPEAEVVAAFREAGTAVVITVTSPEEALTAKAAGASALCAQGVEAGAHRGTLVNAGGLGPGHGVLELVSSVASAGLPVIAAGGIMTSGQVRAVKAAGAVAAQCGTAFLRCHESGAHPVHKAALADPRFTTTMLTRAFSGRPARGLVNKFMLDHTDAPAAYPEINNATRSLRAAAAARGDTDQMSLYAGEGFRLAADLPAGEIVERLAGRLSGLLPARSHVYVRIHRYACDPTGNLQFLRQIGQVVHHWACADLRQEP